MRLAIAVVCAAGGGTATAAAAGAAAPAPALPAWTEHNDSYCVGNHPGPPDYEGNDTNAECRARCEAEAGCLCYDVLGQPQPGQFLCRLTSASEAVADSVAGYTAFTPAGGGGGAVEFTLGLVGTAAEAVAGSGSGAEGRRVGGGGADGGQPFRHFWRSCGWCPPDPHPLFPEFFARDDVWQNHAVVGSTPNRGVEFVRIHYLLDLLSPAVSSTPAAARAPVGDAAGYVAHRLRELSQLRGDRQYQLQQRTHGRDGRTGAATSGSAASADSAAAAVALPELDWSALDAAMDSLVQAGLVPGFEVMGNPGREADRSDRLFTSFADAAQLAGWRDLVQAVASRYIARFGAPAVARWRFESWNEPEGQCRRNLTVGIACDLQSFLGYWDATALGLSAATAAAGLDGPLVLGGPASDGDKSFLFALIQHCLNGTNALDGSPGCGQMPAFLNAHLKGDESSEAISIAELPFALEVQKQVAGTVLEGTPWGNDEADPKVGWSHLYDWRGDVRYAGMVPKVIAQHQQQFIENHNITYELLGNDNGFLPYADNAASNFQQRTLVARWMINASMVPGATRDRAELVRKPVLNVMALLARLGGRLYDHGAAALPASIATVGMLGTSRGFGFPSQGPDAATATAADTAELAALVYNSADSAAPDPAGTRNVSLRFNLTAAAAAELGADAAVALFVLDNGHGSALAEWEAQGLPKMPTPAQFVALREAAEVVVAPSFPRTVNLTQPLEFQLAQPGVALVHACSKPDAAPAAVTNLRVHAPLRPAPNATTQQLLVLWDADDDTTHRCLQTFVVSCGSNSSSSYQGTGNGGGRGEPQRINAVDTLFTSFAHAQDYMDPADACCYTVSAVDYWGRAGPPTQPVCPP